MLRQDGGHLYSPGVLGGEYPADSLSVRFEAAVTAKFAIKDSFTDMAEWRVAHIVKKSCQREVGNLRVVRRICSR
ncbi:hypothetical protein GCM10011591_02470 [Nocardia camponoti]|uniref:Uncharacterized protein n=1 Tax=Nocardia camponoti TaxID=1616106 RepID=A0A917V453_9NOCA|nr:hypothetical protein GCM10011591_02470 [Nocardia camponoti]